MFANKILVPLFIPDSGPHPVRLPHVPPGGQFDGHSSHNAPGQSFPLLRLPDEPRVFSHIQDSTGTVHEFYRSTALMAYSDTA